jgi:hypothetical protein
MREKEARAWIEAMDDAAAEIRLLDPGIQCEVGRSKSDTDALIKQHLIGRVDANG